MIIGACPYPDCDEPFMLPIAAAGYEKWTCEKCQRVIWTRHSRIDPWGAWPTVDTTDWCGEYQRGTPTPETP